MCDISRFFFKENADFSVLQVYESFINTKSSTFKDIVI